MHFIPWNTSHSTNPTCPDYPKQGLLIYKLHTFQNSHFENPDEATQWAEEPIFILLYIFLYIKGFLLI